MLMIVPINRCNRDDATSTIKTMSSPGNSLPHPAGHTSPFSLSCPPVLSTTLPRLMSLTTLSRSMPALYVPHSYLFPPTSPVAQRPCDRRNMRPFSRVASHLYPPSSVPPPNPSRSTHPLYPCTHYYRLSSTFPPPGAVRAACTPPPVPLPPWATSPHFSS